MTPKQESFCDYTRCLLSAFESPHSAPLEKSDSYLELKQSHLGAHSKQFSSLETPKLVCDCEWIRLLLTPDCQKYFSWMNYSRLPQASFSFRRKSCLGTHVYKTLSFVNLCSKVGFRQNLRFGFLSLPQCCWFFQSTKAWHQLRLESRVGNCLYNFNARY